MVSRRGREARPLHQGPWAWLLERRPQICRWGLIPCTPAAIIVNVHELRNSDCECQRWARKNCHLLTPWRACVCADTLAGLSRCGKSCRLRWINYLRPDLKRGAFSQEEEKTIIELHAVLGNRFVFPPPSSIVPPNSDLLETLKILDCFDSLLDVQFYLCSASFIIFYCWLFHASMHRWI